MFCSVRLLQQKLTWWSFGTRTLFYDELCDNLFSCELPFFLCIPISSQCTFFSFHSFIFMPTVSGCLPMQLAFFFLFSFARLNDITSSDQKRNTVLDGVSESFESRWYYQSYSTVYIVAQDIILFKDTLFNNNQAPLTVVICSYFMILKCYMYIEPKSWAYVVLLF